MRRRVNFRLEMALQIGRKRLERVRIDMHASGDLARHQGVDDGRELFHQKTAGLHADVFALLEADDRDARRGAAAFDRQKGGGFFADDERRPAGGVGRAEGGNDRR